jgi:acetylornithine deacetylase/succinyl-diaminopimelate desuccinylase-like protein
VRRIIPLHGDTEDDIFMSTAIPAAAIDRQWDDDIVPQLVEYIRIPAKSPHFDPSWKKNGHIEHVIALAEAWVRKQPVRGLEVEIVRLKGRTPLLYFNVPAFGKGARDATVLLYGHLDKQPEMTGWL